MHSNKRLNKKQIIVTGSARHNVLKEYANREKVKYDKNKANILICSSSNMSTPLMQKRRQEFLMYNELVGLDKTLDGFEVHIQNREQVMAIGCMLKDKFDCKIHIRTHPFCNDKIFKELAKNYGIQEDECNSSKDYLLVDQLEKANMVIVIGSTVALEAYAMNKVVLNLTSKSCFEVNNENEYYVSKDFTEFCENYDNIPELVGRAQSLIEQASNYKHVERRKKASDKKIDINKNAVELICTDILKTVSGPKDNKPHKKSRIKWDPLEEISNVNKERVKFHSRHINRTQLASYFKIKNINKKNLEFAPEISWFKTNDGQLYLPIIKALSFK